MRRIEKSRAVAWLAAIGTIAMIASLIVIQFRTIMEMRHEIRSLHAELGQWVGQPRNTEAVSNARVEADAPILNPGEPSQELLRLRGEVGVLRQQITELQEPSLRQLKTFRRDIEADSLRLKLVSDRLDDAKVAPADRAQAIVSAGFKDSLLNTLLEQLSIAEHRQRRLAAERGNDDGDVQHAWKQVADLNVKIDERCQGLLMGLAVRVSSMKEAAERLQAEVQKSATDSR
jgi:hypothetical protein